MTTVDPSFTFLSSLADILKEEFISRDNSWDESPFNWVLTLPPPTKGKFGIRIISSWCGAKGLRTESSPDSDADLLINGHRAEIKFSTLWRNGSYRFQQIRDQDYEYLIAFGLSPFNAHCWVIKKSTLREFVLGHQPQHGGSRGRDTFWFPVLPDDPPIWLNGLGGSLDEAFIVLKSLSKR